MRAIFVSKKQEVFVVFLLTSGKKKMYFMGVTAATSPPLPKKRIKK